MSWAKSPNHLYNTLKKAHLYIPGQNENSRKLSVRTELQNFTVDNRVYNLHSAVAVTCSTPDQLYFCKFALRQDKNPYQFSGG